MAHKLGDKLAIAGVIYQYKAKAQDMYERMWGKPPITYWDTVGGYVPSAFPHECPCCKQPAYLSIFPGSKPDCVVKCEASKYWPGKPPIL